MDLTDQQRDMLKQASRSAIRESIPELIKHWKAESWFSCDNIYQKNTIKQIKKDSASSKNFTHDHLSEYVAASAITHCFDGWSYLGRALDAEMAGDPNVARHLSYYAELRAAMSVLASEGIGVFKDVHIIVTKKRECLALKNIPTHEVVWEALQFWASSTAGIDTVLQVIRPGSLPLQEWLDQLPSTETPHSIAEKWLLQWGFDLSLLTDDKTARNLASYRPTAFTSSGPRPIQDTMMSVSQLWGMYEPGTRGGFPVLDRHLLRHSLELTFKNAYGRTQSLERQSYEKYIQKILENLNPSDLSFNQWVQFLCGTQDNMPQTILDANKEDDFNQLNHSKQVLARAALLLRIATGCSANLLSETEPVTKAELEFWWLNASVRRRLWPKAIPPSSFHELWLDIDEALESIDQWLENCEESACHHSLWNKNSLATSTLATTERAFLWGIGL